MVTLGIPSQAKHTKVILSTCRKLSCLSTGKNQLNPLGFSGDTAKKELILGNLGMPGYAHLKR